MTNTKPSEQAMKAAEALSCRPAFDIIATAHRLSGGVGPSTETVETAIANEDIAVARIIDHHMNIQSLITERDRLREAVQSAIEAMETCGYDIDHSPDFDEEKIDQAITQCRAVVGQT